MGAKNTGIAVFLALVAGCTGSSPPGTDGGNLDGTDAADTDTGITFGAPPWVKDGVFYHVYVRAFADSDDDGIGDLSGLTARLDHIAGLGVTGILLLPVFEGYGWDSGGYLTTDPLVGAPLVGARHLYRGTCIGTCTETLI